MNIPINEDLVSGLLTALNQFTMVELKQPIESIDMGGLRWSYVLDDISKILFIGADTKQITTEMLRSRILVIKHSFIKDYLPEDPDWRSKWNGNIDRFRPFKATIDEYYQQWLQAENITNIAEFFDILGIFQQLFNLIQNIIDAQLNDLEKLKTYDRVTYMFDLFQSHKFIVAHPELSKIEFTKDSGFNIIGINPMAAKDFLMVEKQLINLLKGLIDILREEVTPRSRLIDLFISGTIFDYIFNNFQLLRELNLDKFLLQLFL